jgi:hypothetical protein
VTVDLADMEAPDPSGARRASRDRLMVRLLGVASVLILVVGLVGLATVDGNSSRSSGSSVAAVLDAAARTSSATSARMSMNATSAVKGTGVPTVAMDGLVEFGGEHRMSATMQVGKAKLDLLNVGQTAYFRVPPGMGAGVRTPWVAVDGPDAASVNNLLLGGFTGPSVAGGGDAMATLQRLRGEGVVTSASSAGHRDVRGTATTVYHVVLDPARFMAALARRTEAAGQAAGLSTPSFDVREATLDLYVDGDGLVRRQALALATSVGLADQHMDLAVNTTIDFYDFGVPVDIQAPPADQVTVLSSSAQLGALLAGGR